jgi:hypothetical protein
MEFKNREEIIAALVVEYGENPKSFNNNEKTKSREKFWTFNRLHKYYWNMKCGMIRTYLTELNPKTGYYELKKS